jgi:gamma-glutamylcyclotransferase (GGCT)/AIG2-like uncharacterized protein YtfP
MIMDLQNRKLYLAYGMNTNKEGMRVRCPHAISLGKILVKDHQFKFKYHADAEYCEGAEMECALWSITPKCEQALDALEGYPVYYNKKNLVIEYMGMPSLAMIYFMNNGVEENPSREYYDSLVEGYLEHGMNLEQLNKELV